MSYRIREVAERANVPEDFVRRLVAVGALPAEEAGLGPREVRRTRLLHSWTAARLSVETRSIRFHPASSRSSNFTTAVRARVEFPMMITVSVLRPTRRLAPELSDIAGSPEYLQPNS